MTNQMQVWRKCLNNYYKTYHLHKKEDECYKIYQDYVKCNVKCYKLK